MNSPKISIIIPSYNKGQFIDKTLSSIFNQNYKNIEVIIQDGYSSDATKYVVKKYLKKHKNALFWESKKDGGQLFAINKGLSKATGDIVTFINADDYYYLDAFEKVVNTYSSNKNKLWFVGRGISVDIKGLQVAKLATKYKDFLLKLNKYPMLLITNYIMQPSVFITRNAINKYGPFSGNSDFVMEYDLWLKLGREEMPVVIDTPLSKFRIVENTITKRLYKKILLADQTILGKYTNNFLIKTLHKIHNLARIFYINLI